MILFNGATGGLGRYLSPELEKTGLHFFVLRSRLGDRAGLKTELETCGKTIPPSEPLMLIQMAALVPVAYCESHPQEAMQINVTDTLTTVSDFISWSRQREVIPRVLYVSTGHVYGKSDIGEKLTESSPVNPRSVYAKTKRQAEEALSALAVKTSTDVMVARVFGLISPRQPPAYVLPGLVRRVRDSDYSGIPGLENVRDYLDSRDVCAHLAALCQIAWTSPETSIVNICSGEPLSIREILMKVAKILKADKDSIENHLSAAPGRADDVTWIVGDPSRLISLTKRPTRQISIEQTIEDLVN